MVDLFASPLTPDAPDAVKGAAPVRPMVTVLNLVTPEGVESCSGCCDWRRCNTVTGFCRSTHGPFAPRFGIALLTSYAARCAAFASGAGNTRVSFPLSPR